MTAADAGGARRSRPHTRAGDNRSASGARTGCDAAVLLEGDGGGRHGARVERDAPHHAGLGDELDVVALVRQLAQRSDALQSCVHLVAVASEVHSQLQDACGGGGRAVASAVAQLAAGPCTHPR
jgi:hypothetical protein